MNTLSPQVAVSQIDTDEVGFEDQQFPTKHYQPLLQTQPEISTVIDFQSRVKGRINNVHINLNQGPDLPLNVKMGHFYNWVRQNFPLLPKLTQPIDSLVREAETSKENTFFDFINHPWVNFSLAIDGNGSVKIKLSSSIQPISARESKAIQKQIGEFMTPLFGSAGEIISEEIC